MRTRKLYKIRLFGILAKMFTKEVIELNAYDVHDIMQGLICRFGEEFRQTILDGEWSITTNKNTKEVQSSHDNFISETILDFPIDSEFINIFPAIRGSGGKGVGQILLGVILIIVVVAYVFFTGPVGAFSSWAAFSTAAGTVGMSLLTAGALSIAGGLLSSLTNTPSISDYSSAASGADPKLSFLFNGAINNTEQGVPVPLVYGRYLTGSTVISASFDTVQL